MDVSCGFAVKLRSLHVSAAAAAKQFARQCMLRRWIHPAVHPLRTVTERTVAVRRTSGLIRASRLIAIRLKLRPKRDWSTESLALAWLGARSSTWTREGSTINNNLI